MVYTPTSQIPQLTERLFHQPGLFDFSTNTTSGTGGFFNLRLKIKVYGKMKSQKNQNLIQVGDRVDPPLKLLYPKSQ